MDCILSIIIPTKNRSYYAEKTIKQVLSATSDHAQIVVSDNSDTQELNEIILGLKSNRIKYIYTENDISMVDNYALAIKESSGEYVCCIGDDDGVLPALEQLAFFMNDHDIEAAIHPRNAQYWWPSNIVPPQFQGKGNFDGWLRMPMPTGVVRFIDVHHELKKTEKDGVQSIFDYNVTRLYHGLVSRRVINQMVETTGKYCGGLAPDGYFAGALSCITKKAIYFDYPLTISGACPKSPGATGHIGGFYENPHLRTHKNYDWYAGIPKIFSVETVWADSFMHGVRDVKPQDCRWFNTDVLAMYCLIRHKVFKNEIIKSRREDGLSNVSLVFAFIRILIKKVYRTVFKHNIYRNLDTPMITGIDSIDSAFKEIVRIVSPIDVLAQLRMFGIENGLNIDNRSGDRSIL